MINEISRILMGFAWFVSQAISLGGLGNIWFLGLGTFFLILMIVSFPKKALERKRLVWLSVLPIVWIVVGLWGVVFWKSPDFLAPHPPWKEWPINIAIPVTIILSGTLLVCLRGARVFTAIFVLVNLYFCFMMTLMAGMAVTGVWL